MSFAWMLVVQILEARFYPRSKAVSSFVIVAKIICDRSQVSIESERVAARAVEPFQWDGLLAKLQFLVDSAIPDTCGDLLRLRSDFWSFVPIGRSG